MYAECVYSVCLCEGCVCVCGVCLCVRCVLVCTVCVSVYAECVYSVCLCEGCVSVFWLYVSPWSPIRSLGGLEEPWVPQFFFLVWLQVSDTGQDPWSPAQTLVLH